jgi:hypothetical protein
VGPSISNASDDKDTAPSVNELRGLVKRNAPLALERVATEFPEFAPTITEGIPLGGEAEHDDKRAYVEKSAMLAVRLGSEVLDVVAQRIVELRRKAGSRRKIKLTLLTLGGVSGAGTIGALGASTDVSARIGTVVTSLVAIGNAIYDFIVRQGDENMADASSKLAKGKHQLTIYCEELKSAVEEHIDVGQMKKLINKANGVAEELSGESAKLGI